MMSNHRIGSLSVHLGDADTVHHVYGIFRCVVLVLVLVEVLDTQSNHFSTIKWLLGGNTCILVDSLENADEFIEQDSCELIKVWYDA